MAGNRFNIQRILVALDAETRAELAVEMAADIAVHLRADMAGLFVESDELVHLEGHPSARHIELPTGYTGTIEEGLMQRDLRALALQIRQHVREVSIDRKLSWSFDVSRGTTVREVEAECVEDDLVVVESTGRHVAGDIEFGTSATELARGLSQSVLILHQGFAPIHTVTVVYDGTEIGKKALEAASELASKGMTLLTVLLQPPTGPTAEQLGDEVAGFVEDVSDVRYHRLATNDPREVHEANQMLQGDLLVLGANRDELYLDSIIRLLDTPTLLVR